jgi:signal transduction histidine kinase
VGRWSLRGLLLTGALALVAASVLAGLSMTFLQVRGLSREEVQARAARAAGVGAEELVRLREAVERSASLLAERPSLARLGEGPRRSELEHYLDRFRSTSRLDGVAIRIGGSGGDSVTVGELGGPLAAALDGAALERPEGSGWRVVARAEGILEEGRPVAVAVVRRLDGPTWSAVERESGARLELLSRADAESATGPPLATRLREALGGTASLGWEPGQGAFGVHPVRSLVGPGVDAVVVARIDRSEADAAVRAFAWRAAASSAVIAGVAALAAALAARRLTAPLTELAHAAGRIGGGDLDTGVPVPGGIETGALANALDRMRRDLRESRAEVERRKSELETVVEGVEVGVLAVDRERRIRFLSSSAGRLLGIDPGDGIGRFCGDVLRPEAVGALPCEEDCPILHARFRGSSSALERSAAAGQPIVVSSSAPVAERQVLILRRETPVDAARRARDAVVADLAHELKTPLAAQRASLELLRDRLAESEPEASKLIEAAEAGTSRLERLIENLLESVRIESGQLAVRRAAVDLEEVVEEAISTAAPLLAQRRQRLELDLPFPLPPAIGDAQRLVQVLVNLLSNASKYSPAGSEVRVGGAVRAEEVALWVEDEGPGLDPGLLAGLGQRFRRGRAAGEPREEGSGLGLWISRSIAQRHGGHLEVARVDGRTRAELRLPLEERAS